MRNSQIPFVIIDIEVEINCLFIVIIVVLKWILNNYYLSLDHQVYDQCDRVDTQLDNFFKKFTFIFLSFISRPFSRILTHPRLLTKFTHSGKILMLDVSNLLANC